MINFHILINSFETWFHSKAQNAAESCHTTTELLSRDKYYQKELSFLIFSSI